MIGDRTCFYLELPAIKHFLDVTSPDPERVDACGLCIDYIKPSCFNRRGRPRLAGGGGSESGRPAGPGDCAGCGLGSGPPPRRATRLEAAARSRGI